MLGGRRHRLGALVAFLALGCGASNADIAAMAIGTGLAVGASAVERSQGGCFAVCVHGTVCNPNTGYCDPLPCRGECRVNEYCKKTAQGEYCEAVTQPDIGITASPLPAPTQAPATRDPATPAGTP